MRVVVRPLPAGFDGVVMVTVCVNRRENTGGLAMASCGARGSEAIAVAVERGLAERGLRARFATIKCLGLCEKGPNIRLAPSNSWFQQLTLADVPAVLDAIGKHIEGGRADTVANADAEAKSDA
jgi:(2Fe-2S) ferredoxin